MSSEAEALTQLDELRARAERVRTRLASCELRQGSTNAAQAEKNTNAAVTIDSAEEHTDVGSTDAASGVAEDSAQVALRTVRELQDAVARLLHSVRACNHAALGVSATDSALLLGCVCVCVCVLCLVSLYICIYIYIYVCVCVCVCACACVCTCVRVMACSQPRVPSGLSNGSSCQCLFARFLSSSFLLLTISFVSLCMCVFVCVYARVQSEYTRP
jgi:hypothetical protein